MLREKITADFFIQIASVHRHVIRIAASVPASICVFLMPNLNVIKNNRVCSCFPENSSGHVSVVEKFTSELPRHVSSDLLSRSRASRALMSMEKLARKVSIRFTLLPFWRVINTQSPSRDRGRRMAQDADEKVIGR
jgi:hypothetical protein